jgi:hypothetical protein
MLTKTKLRALSPGQWARVRVPDFECWRKDGRGYCRTNPGDEVDICVMPIYGPHYESRDHFQWSYRVAYRGPQSSWANYQSADGSGWIGPWEFGLIDASTNSPNWDNTTAHDHSIGKGKWLYEPASDDPAICPGGDWSRYECSLCGKFVKPFSNDAGDLLCPTCEVTGLVILDDEQLDRLEQVREFARSIGLSEQLERQLNYLHGYANHDDAPKRQCVLAYDFAPHSFSFAHYVLPTSSKDGTRKFWFNGAMIWQGPSCPADGSFPSLTVSLAEGTGWFCHT